MLNRLWNFIGNQGYMIMLVAMGIVIAGALMLVQGKRTMGSAGQFAWPIIITGLAIYVIGRIGVAFRGKRKPHNQDRSDSET